MGSVQEYKRAYRRHFPYASRFAKLGYWTFTFYAVLYFVLYARDQQQMYQRLKWNIDDYKQKRTMYLDLPDGYLTKLVQQEGL